MQWKELVVAWLVLVVLSGCVSRSPTRDIDGAQSLERHCPLDGFELVLISYGSGSKSYPLCPYCYNHPVLDGMEEGMACNQCPHPTCLNSMNRNYVTRCDECDTGLMVLNQFSAPKWRMECNKCNYVIRVLDDTCHSMSANQPANQPTNQPTNQYCTGYWLMFNLHRYW
jgi:hypothetical protein